MVAFDKMLVSIENRKAQIRLLLQKQSDLRLLCLSRLFDRKLVFKMLENPENPNPCPFYL